MSKHCDFTDCVAEPTVQVEFTAPTSNGLRGSYCEEHASIAQEAFPTRVVDASVAVVFAHTD